MASGCDALADAEPQALGLTYWFDAASEGDPYSVAIEFCGRRVGVNGKPGPRDSFRVLQRIDSVVPGSGRIAITTRVVDIAPGEWQVTAAPLKSGAGRGSRARARSRQPASPPRASAAGRTGFEPLIRIRGAGARPAAWPALVGLGVVVAIALQGLLAARAELPVGHLVVLSLLACLVGLLAAKIYYWALFRRHVSDWLSTGMCLQGFVIGAVAALILGSLLAGVQLGKALDATAPGLLFGLAIGRLGCFFGGCCVGRPTASRWGLWSSDKTLATRRIPIQLFESALAAILGLSTLALVLLTSPHPAGVAFVGGLAAYTLGRQLLLPLRHLPRKTARGRGAVVLVAGLVLAIDLATAALV